MEKKIEKISEALENGFGEMRSFIKDHKGLVELFEENHRDTKERIKDLRKRHDEHGKRISAIEKNQIKYLAGVIIFVLAMIIIAHIKL